MSYKKKFLSLIVCTQLLVQPIQSIQNSKKRTQPSAWSWKALALTAASIPLTLGFLKLINLASNYLAKKENENQTTLNESNQNQQKPQTIDDFVKNLSQEEKNAYSDFDNTVIDYLLNKEDWENVYTIKQASMDDINFLMFLDRNIQLQNIKDLKKDARINFKKNEKSNEYLIEQNNILKNPNLFKEFLQNIETTKVKEKLNFINEIFTTLQEKYYEILLNNPTDQNSLKIKKRHVDYYNQVDLPLYALLFNFKKNEVYEIFSTKPTQKSKTFEHLLNTTRIHYIYNEEENEFEKKESNNLFLNQIIKSFIDIYLKYYEPTKTLAAIKKDVSILTKAKKLEETSKISAQENWESKERYLQDSKKNQVSTIPKNLSPLKPERFTKDIQDLDPEAPSKTLKRLSDYN